MSYDHSSDKRITVWVQNYADRPFLMLQWIDPETGKRKSESTGTNNRGIAEMKRTEREFELNRGLHRESSRMSWEKFRQLFEAECFPGRREDTRKVYTTAFNHFERICHPTSLRSITARTISQFAAAIRAQPGRLDKAGWSPWTLKVRLSFLHCALNWAVEQKFIPECPTFPEVRVPKTKPRPVPAEPIEKLLAKADEQLRAFLLCGWLAGLRRKEALLLEWEETDAAPWVDLARRRIWLPAGFVKGGEDQWVPLDPQLAEVLAVLPRHGRKVFQFLNYLGQPLTLSGVSLMITKLAKSAGVKLNMKTLRKAFGSRYAGKVSAQVLQKLMRHANITTTMDFYANIDQAVEDAVLGSQHNSSHNSRPVDAEGATDGVDASHEPGQGFDRTDESL
jgi:integrase